ncbi:VOC family protein [Novosphingobium terrae]|uniref:VOC family protein n=1 Tax=Novosphingobium terrae TaxID=2726189 RepID=UPI001982129B|nr:VOC family protein [Novosphingobium terrae]
MTTITIEDVESVRFSAPDLAQMRDFLRDFGMVEAEDTGDGILRMRGTSDTPFLHETVQGEPAYVSLTLRAASLTELESLAEAEGVPVEPAPGPGGGSQITLRDPDGFQVHVIAGKARMPITPGEAAAAWNTIAGRDRPNQPKRMTTRPAGVARLGHVVLGVSDLQATWDWWRARFALLMSDEVRTPDGIMIAAFIRLDRGALPTDHHSLNFATMPGRPPAFHHAAFEVADLDDLMVGHEHLKQAGHQQLWGVGRHILGSQVFDYWRDPWGHRIEHWTDGDVFSAETPGGVHGLPVLLGQQWGPDAPADFV